jgi:hypothetical protein
MERVNRRSRQDKLDPGERLIVYTKREAVAGMEGSAPPSQPLSPVDAPHPEALPELVSERPTAELTSPGPTAGTAD